MQRQWKSGECDTRLGDLLKNRPDFTKRVQSLMRYYIDYYYYVINNTNIVLYTV